jgi:hypothetical protein
MAMLPLVLFCATPTNDTSSPADPITVTCSPAVTIDLPSEIPLRSVLVHCASGSVLPGANGQVTLDAYDSMPFLAVAKIGEAPVAMSFVDPRSGANSLSCFETAVSMIAFRGALTTLPDHLFAAALDTVRQLPHTDTVGQRIGELLSRRTDAMTRGDDTLTHALIHAVSATLNRFSGSKGGAR